MLTTIETKAYFEDIGFHLKNELRAAKESVKICVAWINWSDYTPIFNQLIAKGVSVEVMYFDDYLNRKNLLRPSRNVVLYPIKTRFIMHNKFCIIDNRAVITGSYNWSRMARKHFENIVLINNDFHLVKQYLSEYEDLITYFSDYAKNSKITCMYEDQYTERKCRASSFNLGIWGHESGKYEESLIEVWNICINNDHGTFLYSVDEQFLDTSLGLKDAPDLYHGGVYTKEIMLEEFAQERERMSTLHDYFSSGSDPIHAIGVIAINNEFEHLEYNEDAEYVVKVIWKDMYYRKRIPDEFYDDGFVSEIIERQLRY
ncbi:phospholipase D-like domain-containing protein [Vibrio parahaemolyticus]